MGKKKFIDKKRSATYQLLARDSSDSNYDATQGNDRVFVRIDNNPISLTRFVPEENAEDPDSIFADATEEDADGNLTISANSRLPEHVRREILELGFPDDGYNYLLHLREIKNAGGGSSFYHNPKANFDQIPHDVKAYDATRVMVEKLNSSDANDDSICRIASKTMNARTHKAIDPDVEALLDDIKSSMCDSEVDELEEDFVLRANQPDCGDVNDDSYSTDALDESKGPFVFHTEKTESENSSYTPGIPGLNLTPNSNAYAVQEPRARRLLDDQFDLLQLQEYESDQEKDYDDYPPEDDEILTDKLNKAFKDVDMQDLELDGNYIAPADILHGSEHPVNQEALTSAADVMRRCVAYATRYENENENEGEEVVCFSESSSDSDEWDCETIVSTYSNLDNHPGRIGAPGDARKKKLSEAVFGDGKFNAPVIDLRSFRPGGKKDKKKIIPSQSMELPIRKQKGQESKEEKKERQAAVKKERREARRAKKELKGLYRCEAQRAQRVAASTAPASIHLM